MAEKPVVLLPAGTVLLAGDPPPPTKSGKAIRAGYWAALPIFMGCVVTAFQQFGVFYPEAPDWVLRTVAYLLLVLGPVFAYLGVTRATDELRQPVETIEGVSLDGRPVVLTTPPGKHARPEDIVGFPAGVVGPPAGPVSDNFGPGADVGPATGPIELPED